jgi:hypothetical protein
MALSSTIKVNIAATQTNPLDLGTGSFPAAASAALTLANGTGNGQADVLFSDQRTITASSNEDLDFAGVLVGAFGATATFARLKVLYVKAATANVNNVVITRPAANGVPIFAAASDAISVRPGGVFLWACTDATGVVVTAATADLINISNSGAGTSVVYDIVAIGASV